MATDSTEERRSELVGALSAFGTSQDDFRVREFDHDMIADALAMRQLRAALDAFASQYHQRTKPDGARLLQRSDIIALLTCLQVSLSKNLMQGPDSPSAREDDLEMIFEHPTMSLLREFVDALSNLDIDKTDTVFEHRGNSLGRSKPHYEVRWRDALLELVDVIRIRDKLRSTAAAERKVVEMIRKNPKRRERDLTAKRLKEMRKTRRKSQRRRVGN